MLSSYLKSLTNKSQIFRVSTGLNINGKSSGNSNQEILLLIEYTPISAKHFHIRASLQEGERSISKREDFGDAILKELPSTMEDLYLDLADVILEKATTSETAPHGVVARWLYDHTDDDTNVKVAYA